MEVSNNTAMQYFKIPRNILGNLKISYYDDTFHYIIVLWSKYELYIFNPTLKDTITDFNVQFEIEQVLVSGDCLLCLDCSGIINLCTAESSSIYNRQNIKCVYALEITDTQHVVSLQFERNICKLLVNKFDIDFESQNEFELGIPNENWNDSERGKSIITAGHIKPEHLKRLKETFDVKNADLDHILVIVSVDRRNVYAVLIPAMPITNVIVSRTIPSINSWEKLHSSCSEIVDIKITMTEEIYILLGLAAGNIIKIPLSLRNKKPQVTHLNTGINKFALIGDKSIIYSDGLTMWKNENMFSQSNCEFEQFVVRNVRDFCLIKKQLYCITYSNLIYSFDVGQKTSYVKVPDTESDSCDVELVTNSNYLQKTVNIVEKNKQLLEKINKETEYLMAMSLSKRQDIMDQLLQINVSVFDDFKDVTQKYTDLTLTDELNSYYDSQSYYVLVQISVAKIQHKLNKLLSDVLGDIKLHITLHDQEVLKTTSIQIKEQLTKKNYVISLKKENRNIKRVQMYIKIITNIPGKFYENERLWLILYRKKIVLRGENFINIKTSTNSILLKEDELPLELLICKMTNHLHGTHYIHNNSNNQRFEWVFYVKLPSGGNLHMGNIIKLVENLDSKSTEAFRKYVTKFSKFKNQLELEIGQERVNINIEDETLKVRCPDLIIASDIRNFFSSIIFTAFKSKPALLIFNNSLTVTIENWKKDIEINKRRKGVEFARLLIELLRDIHCTIPI